ncbi:helix-turn-helix domain-containing protein [Flagellimonas nanhaiensis]|uniref:AraC family transcriptional regulator n=1 Tax=Flagellimonas nanhaiensis TaxID=2292706 RepID=A0A371JVX6_9FLAO|nr:helix-turn-helix domain-containing protein [Allomuricauda nanhaiensis]RDY61943.1 AraC family transcriptional regulator [Allomuricauda nanhaiensis]
MMEEIPIRTNLISQILILGVFLGIYLSYFLIKKSLKTKSPNFFMGLLLLILSLIMLEGWLNYTSYIFRVLFLTNFSEPLNFAIAPVIYLFMSSQLGDKRTRMDWLHFIPFVLWLGYCMFFFGQPDVFKYNDNLVAMNLGIPSVKTTQPYVGDPLSIRNYVNLATIIHIVVYNIILTRRLLLAVRKNGETVFNTKDKKLRSIRNSFYHFLIVTLILVFVKANYISDVGDYLIFLYMTFMIFLTSHDIMNTSSYYKRASSFLEGPVLKYKKSSLADEDKSAILEAIFNQMKNEKYFMSSTASLSGLAKSINESSHHVSQVINEKLGLSFFELLATYRVEEAKEILNSEMGKKLTIEEIAERVGYNSKSAFNTAFKKITSHTPSSFRDL